MEILSVLEVIMTKDQDSCLAKNKVQDSEKNSKYDNNIWLYISPKGRKVIKIKKDWLSAC